MAKERKIIQEMRRCMGAVARCHECPYRVIPDDGKCFERLMTAAIDEIHDFEMVLAEQRKEYMQMEKDLTIAQRLVVKDCSTCESRYNARCCDGCVGHSHWRCRKSFRVGSGRRKKDG